MENICHGAQKNGFATFAIIQDCQMVALRLPNISGYLSGNNRLDQFQSNWGTKNSNCPRNLSTIILKGNELWLPGKLDSTGIYELDGFYVNDDLLILL